MYSLIVLLALLLADDTMAAQSSADERFHRPQELMQTIEDSENIGQSIYQYYCASCHAPEPMIRIGAPRLGFADEWQDSLQYSLDELLQRTDEGVGQMPPRGGCFDCTDEQLKAAIIYLLPNHECSDNDAP